MDDRHNGFLSIGQFAQASQLSLKALRIYHEQGLLAPAHIDPDSGYRYYLVEQLKTTDLIRLLRGMDMPLTMVQQVLQQYPHSSAEATAVVNRYLRLFESHVTVVRNTVEETIVFLQQEGQMSTTTTGYRRPTQTINRTTAQETLKTVLHHVTPILDHTHYRFVGTGAALLHGVDLPAKGIDFVMRERNAVDAFNLAMAPFQCQVPPTLLAEDKQYWAVYQVNGVEVAASTVEWETEADSMECIGSGAWTHFTMIPCGIYNVPTVNLELRLVTELCRERPDRYKPLIRYMRGHGCDLNLVQRGLVAQGIDPTMQAEVLRQLQAG